MRSVDSMDYCTMHPVYCSVDLFYGFSFREIILKVMKIPKPL
jgi:hypothetical protein